MVRLCPWLPLVLLSLGCGGGGESLRADQVAYGEGTVASALQELEQASAATVEGPAPEDAPVTKAQLDALDERLVRLELRMAELDTTGIIAASSVGYDPRSTTLGGTDAQAAIDELYTRLAKLEQDLSRGSMGQPSEELFRVGAKEVEAAGGRGGPGGRPPGGQPGGGGPPQGGGQPGGGR